MVGLDAIFEHIVARSAKGHKGQYFTPRHVIDEIVTMVAPEAGERVVDPACGSGGFLCHAARRAPRCEAWGFDLDPRAARVARVMLAASGQSAARIQCLDSLQRPLVEGALASGAGGAALDGRRRRGTVCDVVLTNPPFAGDVGGSYAGYQLGADRRVERDVLFLERVIELLRPGGRFAIVLPHNKLAAPRWAYARRWLLCQAQVVAVLSLGRHTFLPHTSQKACVVVGRRRARPLTAPAAAEEIHFFLSESDGKDARGRLRRRADGAVDHDLGVATVQVRARLAAGSAGSA
jgi:type I restriction enzyme M protein